MDPPATVGVVSSDVESSGLLDGLDGTARDERAELVAWLFGQGFTVREIGDSFAPLNLPARRALGDDGGYVSAREMSAQAGLDLDLLIRFLRAAGLPHVDDPDAPVFKRADCVVALHLKRFLDLGIDPERMLALVRVLADNLANVAEEMRGAALATVLRGADPGATRIATELELAQAMAAVTAAAVPLLGPMIQDLLLMQLRRMAETEAVSAAERAAGEALPGARLVAAAFADLVGFTRLGEEVPPGELGKLADRLTNTARAVVIPPVRFIKTIGDAVMFVSPDTAALLHVLLALIEATDADEAVPRLRVGIAYGAAVSRAGDWFGSPVNLASRVTSVARPGTVLVAESARDQIGENPAFTWSFAGPRRLRGVRSEVNLYRARRAGGPAQG